MASPLGLSHNTSKTSPGKGANYKVYDGGQVLGKFKSGKKVKSLFGCIFNHQTWGYTYNQYDADIKKRKLSKSVVKIWTGR